MRRCLKWATVTDAVLALVLLLDRALFPPWCVGYIDFPGFVSHVAGVFVFFLGMDLFGLHSFEVWPFYTCLAVTNLVLAVVFFASLFYMRSSVSQGAVMMCLLAPLVAATLGFTVCHSHLTLGDRAKDDHDRSREIRMSFGRYCTMVSLYEDIVYDGWFGGKPPPKSRLVRLEFMTVAGVDYALRAFVLANLCVGVYAGVRRVRSRLSRGRHNPQTVH
jgi:hypothetical protein